MQMPDGVPGVIVRVTIERDTSNENEILEIPVAVNGVL